MHSHNIWFVRVYVCMYVSRRDSVRSLLLRMDEDTKPLINPMRYSDPSPVPNLWSAMGMEDRSPSEEPEQPEP